MFIVENVKHIRKHIENTSSKIVQNISFRLFLCNKNSYHLLFKWNLTITYSLKNNGRHSSGVRFPAQEGAAMTLGS